MISCADAADAKVRRRSGSLRGADAQLLRHGTDREPLRVVTRPHLGNHAHRCPLTQRSRIHIRRCVARYRATGRARYQTECGSVVACQPFEPHTVKYVDPMSHAAVDGQAPLATAMKRGRVSSTRQPRQRARTATGSGVPAQMLVASRERSAPGPAPSGVYLAERPGRRTAR
jgi:hypothetical protein